MFAGLGEIVERLLTATPFEPFVLVVGGEAIEITSAETAKIIGEDFTTRVLYEPKLDQTRFVNLEAVEQIKVRGRRLKF